VNAASAVAPAPGGAEGPATGRSSVAIASDASSPASSACTGELERSIGGLVASQMHSAAQPEQSCAGRAGAAGSESAAVGQGSSAHDARVSLSAAKHDAAAIRAHAVAELPQDGDSVLVQPPRGAALRSDPAPEEHAPPCGMKAKHDATRWGTVQ
jgi:hypothetical protein